MSAPTMLADPAWALVAVTVALAALGAAWHVHRYREGAMRARLGVLQRSEVHMRDVVCADAVSLILTGLAPMHDVGVYQAAYKDQELRDILAAAFEARGRREDMTLGQQAITALARRVAYVAREALEQGASQFPTATARGIFAAVSEIDAVVAASRRCHRAAERAYGFGVLLLFGTGVASGAGIAHCLWHLPRAACFVHAGLFCGFVAGALAHLRQCWS